MDDDKKRKSNSSHGGQASKRSKPWMVPKKGQKGYVAPIIEPGDAGIWVTCEMGKKGKCNSDLRDLFEDYAAKIYGESNDRVEEAGEDEDVDIEAEINKEVQGLKSNSTKKVALFQTVKMDIQCVLFFKTRPPIEPVEFVHRICKDALDGATKRCRWVKRLTPMTLMGKATVDGLDKVAASVLRPVFHEEGSSPKKFAIRPTRRNHNVLKRDEMIKQVARAVGGKHSVDLKNYDHLILVDVYRNVLGMSVVGRDFEELKQYNLAEIYDPTPKPDAEKIKPTKQKASADESDPSPVPDTEDSNPSPLGNGEANGDGPEPKYSKSSGK